MPAKKLVYWTRQAQTSETADIIDMINQESRRSGRLLPRTFINTSRTIVSQSGKELAGCISYKTYYNGRLPEIISLVVGSKFRNRGVGTSLITGISDLLKAKGYIVTIALTGEPKLFESNKFYKVPIQLFPPKIWKDCRNCPKNYGSPLNPACEETALYKVL